MLNYKFWVILLTTIFFIAGCASRTVDIKESAVAETNTTKTKAVKQQTYHPPKKRIKLKEVQDDNYSSAYMYPEAKVKKEKMAQVPTPPIKTESKPVSVQEAETPSINKSESVSVQEIKTPSMNKTECVGMIGQEKFDKYTQMFGNESSSIKRCAMLKAMN